MLVVLLRNKSLVRSSAVSRGVPLIDKMQIRDGTRVMQLSEKPMMQWAIKVRR